MFLILLFINFLGFNNSFGMQTNPTELEDSIIAFYANIKEFQTAILENKKNLSAHNFSSPVEPSVAELILTQEDVLKNLEECLNKSLKSAADLNMIVPLQGQLRSLGLSMPTFESE